MNPIFWIVGSTIWFTFNPSQPVDKSNFINLVYRNYTDSELSSSEALPDLMVKEPTTKIDNNLEKKTLTLFTCEGKWVLNYDGEPKNWVLDII